MCDFILPCPTYEGGSVYLNGFTDGPKPYEEVLTFLRKGTELIKYGRMGAPKSHPFRLSNDMQELQWESKKGPVRRIPLKSITGWQRGQTTPVFRKYPQPQVEDISFSILYKDENKRSRTLDVICRSKQEFEMWFWGVQIITHYPPPRYSGPSPNFPAAAPHALSSSISAPTPPQQRAAPQPLVPAPSTRAAPAVDDRRPKPNPKTKPMGLNLVVNSMRSSGTSTGGPPTNHRGREMGDLYVWGSLMVAEAEESTTTNPFYPAWKEESLRDYMTSKGPTLVHNATSVDVMRVACAPRHAALITRNGELYTWGYGKDGNLGHGWCSNLASPRLLARMGGRGVRAVSCGEGASAAISSDQRLFMWGRGMAGQLGNGYSFPCAEPAPVTFPGLRDDVKVLGVSCGPFHTAAITEGGLLFTWGNGLFGKLGHGSHRSEYRPRKVLDLEDKYVFNVSCGYWHTAAVAAPRAGSRNGDYSTPASTPGVQATQARQLSTAASAPFISANGDGAGGEDNSRVAAANLRMRSRTVDMSSSGGSDLQGAVAAATANISARDHVTGSQGGGEPSGRLHSHSGPNGGAMRTDDLSGSMASIDKLQEAGSEDTSASPSSSAGMLYTWGCDFSWMEGNKSDHHHGCLGLGDKEGRLVPTRVRGDMDKHGVVQVACGWSMTIALSGDGRVYQMGKTGAHSSADKNCMWEGALSPTRVDGNLFGMFVEEVACGMHHVVVVASRVQANGQIPDDQRRVRLLTWGCGAEGQLGLWGMTTSADAPVAVRAQQTDYHLPQIVGSLDGRRVLHIAAGGNLTMAVMEHDPRTRRSNPGPITSSTPTNPFGGSAAATPSGGGAASRAMSYAPYQAVVGAVATGVRDVSTAAAFQLSQSLPLAAGLQSLQQMVAGSVGTRSKAATPTGAAAADGSHMVRGMRRPKRLVGIPQVTVGQPRSDHHHRSDLRRSASRVLHGQYLSGALGPGQLSSKSMSLSAREGKVLDGAASVSSDVVSQRSSPPLGQPSEDADSRSASPTSSSLYEISSATGDFQTSRHARGAAMDSGRPHASSVDTAATNVSLSAANATNAAVAAVDTDTDTDADTDSYVQGRRSLDMVPEQSEESPGLPSPTSRHAGGHHAMAAHTRAHHAVVTTTAAVPGPGGGIHLHQYTVDGREASAMATQATPAAATPQGATMQSRASRLAQQAPATAAAAPPGAMVVDGSIGETVRSSVSTADSSYTVGGSASSELSPSGLGTPSPETASGEGEPGRSAVGGVPAMQLPYTIPEEQPPSSPPAPQQQQMPFAASHHVSSPSQHQHHHHHPQQPLHPHHHQQPSALQASALPPQPARHASFGSGLPPHDSLGRAQAAALAGGGAGPSASGGTGRNREVSAPLWAQPAAAAAGGSGHDSFRSDGSKRAAYGMHAESATAATVSNAPVNLPMGAGIRSGGSRGSRGHSRHASYDSLDFGSRDGDAIGQRSSSVVVGGGGGFDGRPPSFSLHAGAAVGGGGSSGSGMTQLRGAAEPSAANMALMQQNEFLQKQVEKLMQQVTLLSKAAELNAAMASVGGHAYSPAPAPAVAPQQQASAAAAAAAAAVHGTPQAVAVAAVAAAGGLPPYPGGVAPPPVHFNDAAVGHAAGNGMASVLSLQSPQAPLLHHTFSASMGPVAIAGVTSPGHGFQPLSPGAVNAWVPGPGSNQGMERQGSVAGGQPPPMAPPGGRHKRSASIDVSSLIATRDGIGPAKDYLAAAGPGPIAGAGAGASHQHQHPGERVPSLTREGSALGHHTASPALDTLRQAHPGMSLAQAALREEEDEGFEEDGEEEEEELEADTGDMEPAIDESLGPGGGLDRLESVTVPTVLPLAAQASLHRQLYVSQQQPQAPQPQQQQQHPVRRPSVPHTGHVYEQPHPLEPPMGSIATLAKEGYPRPTSETSYGSSTSGDGTVDTAAADGPGPLGLPMLQQVAQDVEGAGAAGQTGGADGKSIWRSRRNAFVEWAKSMHHEMTEEQPPGSSSGGAAAGAGCGAGGPGVASSGPSGEDSFSGGSFALAPAADSLPPEGKMFQYSPGVYITLKPPQQKGDRIELVKIRFNRKFFQKQADGQAWWNAHKAALNETYKVTATATGAAPSTSGLPPLAPGPPPASAGAAAMHTRGLSNDTQGTSGGSTAASQSSMYFSVPISSPVHGLTGAGSGGSAVSSNAAAAVAGGPLVEGRATWAAGGSGTAGGGSAARDLNMSWADVNYDDPAMPLPPPGMVGISITPPRHHRSRSGSRNASGGSGHSSKNGQSPPPLPRCPESPVLALQHVGNGVPYVGGGLPAPNVPPTAQAYHHVHNKSRSGGASSGLA